MSIADLTGGPTRTARAPAVRGKVLRTPVDVSSPLVVAVVNYSQTYEYEVASGRYSGVFEQGDDCLLVFDDDGDAWVIGGGQVQLSAAKGVAVHGADPDFPRPDFVSVEWHGTVAPHLGQAYDTAYISE